MSSTLTRRLDRLEKATRAGMCDVAAMLDAARARWIDAARDGRLAELEAEQDAEARARLAERRARHAVKPLTGLDLQLLQAAERVERYRTSAKGAG